MSDFALQQRRNRRVGAVIFLIASLTGPCWSLWAFLASSGCPDIPTRQVLQITETPTSLSLTLQLTNCNVHSLQGNGLIVFYALLTGSLLFAASSLWILYLLFVDDSISSELRMIGGFSPLARFYFMLTHLELTWVPLTLWCLASTLLLAVRYSLPSLS